MALPKIANISGQESSYRRGLVLGLTMAEIMILILFVLMLLLMALQTEHEEVVDRQADELAHKAAENNRMQQMVGEYEQIASGKPVTELLRELILQRENVKSIPMLESERDKANAEKTEALANLQAIQDILQKNGLDTTDHTRLAKELVLQRELVETLAANGQPLDPASLDDSLETFDELLAANTADDGRSVAEIKAALESAERKSNRLEGQLANTQNKLSAAGKGGDFPPCWASTEGKIQYIFDVAATSDGMKVREHHVPEREADRKELPLADVVYHSEVSSKTFMDMMRPVYNWSVENECRFWVLIYDHTGSTEKTVWQNRDRQIASRFYRNTLVNDQDWPRIRTE